MESGVGLEGVNGAVEEEEGMKLNVLFYCQGLCLGDGLLSLFKTHVQWNPTVSDSHQIQSFQYKDILMHAIASNPPKVHKPSLYCHLKKQPSLQSLGNGNNKEEEERNNETESKAEERNKEEEEGDNKEEEGDEEEDGNEEETMQVIEVYIVPPSMDIVKDLFKHISKRVDEEEAYAKKHNHPHHHQHDLHTESNAKEEEDDTKQLEKAEAFLFDKFFSNLPTPKQQPPPPADDSDFEDADDTEEDD